jgi:rod shape-determining protein MreD
MIYYLFLPVMSVLVVVLQAAVADIIFSGKLVLEISLVVVIYAGFRLDLIKGSISAFVLGFIFDCIDGSVLGLFSFIYLVFFLISFFVSIRLVTERMYLIALFTLIIALAEEFAEILFYNFVYGFDILQNTPYFFLPQAMIVSLLAPAFFYLMRRVEVFFYDQTAQSAQRPGTGRISAEA